MTDRYKTLTVLLEQDRTELELRPLLEAVRALRGVAEARAGELADGRDASARAQVRQELALRLHNAVDRILEGPVKK